MKYRLKDSIRSVSYLMLIMLLLLGSLPLSGVFAEVNEGNEMTEELLEEESELVINTLEEELESVEGMSEKELDTVESIQEEIEDSESAQEEKLHIHLRASIEKEGHFSYREDYGRSVLLSFFVDELQRDTDIYLTLPPQLLLFHNSYIHLQKNISPAFSLVLLPLHSLS